MVGAMLLGEDPSTLRADPSGFRPRGLDVTRIETVVDAAFAFAVTLLVVSLDFPETLAEMKQALWNAPAFAASFAVLMMFWWGHHRFSRRYGLEDGPTILVSLALVFCVLIYVFPLRFVFLSFVGWIRRDRAAMGMLGPGGGAPELNQLFAIYSAGFLAMSLMLVLLNVHALRLKRGLALSALEEFDTRSEINLWLILCAFGAVSLVVAIALPASRFAAPGWVYMAMAGVMPWWGARVGRRRKRFASREQPRNQRVAQAEDLRPSP